MSHFFSGLYTALVTPFTISGEVDWNAFERMVNHQIDGEVDGIVLLGTTGESSTLSPEEHLDALRKGIEIVDGRTQVIAGTGSNATSEAIRYSIEAQEAGADGLLQVVPYYNKPTQKGLIEHFTAVADSVDIPILLYNIPGRCGINMTADTQLELAQHQNIQGVKECAGDAEQLQRLILESPDDFSVLAGDDDQVMEYVLRGGNGVVSVISNILPKEVRSLLESCQNNEYDRASEIQDQLSPLFQGMLQLESNPQPIKTLMAMEGWCEEVFRSPMTTMEGINRVKLRELWDEYRKR